MSSELVIDVQSNEINIALLTNKKLVELTKEKSNVRFAVGDIYLGKVKKIMPGLNAAFIDVGYERDAFLHYLDLGPQFRSLNKYMQIASARKGMSVSKMKLEEDINKDGAISELLKPGQWILVQVAKEPISTKGPRLTSEISIAGRNMVLMPFADKVSVSQKISSFEEKKRLKKLLESIRPQNYGIIVRTAAENKKVALLDQELRELLTKWEDAFKLFRDLTPPKLVIGEMDRTTAFLRDILNHSFEKIYVNDSAVYKEIKAYITSIAPEKKKIVNYVSEETSIFEQYGIDKQVKSSFGKTVSMKNGAYLIIEHTEAFHVIDVNSGNRSRAGMDQEANALDVNISAAEEIARQLRLRDMGGIIVIDFIDMNSSENRQKVYENMREFMEGDRTKHSILPLSKFGLMQITRQRVRPEMHIDTSELCPECNGTGKVEPSVLITDKIEDKIEYISRQGKHKKIVVRTHPFVAAYITKGLFSLRVRWQNRYKIRIKIVESSSYHINQLSFFDKNNVILDI